MAVLAEGEAGNAGSPGVPQAPDQQRPFDECKKSKGASMAVSELRRVKKLEAENAGLRRLYAELALANAVFNDVVSRKLNRRPSSAQRSRDAQFLDCTRLQAVTAVAAGVLRSSGGLGASRCRCG